MWKLSPGYGIWRHVLYRSFGIVGPLMAVYYQPWPLYSAIAPGINRPGPVDEETTPYYDH